MTERDPIKVYDARWLVDELSQEGVRRLVEATLIYGRLLGVDTVTICRDARIGSGAVMELALETALRAGLNVFLCADPVSTPQSYFASFRVSAEHPGTMGLTITASHNPASYVGLKVVVPPAQAIGLECGPLGGFRRIRDIFHSRETLARSGGGALRVQSLANEYVEFSLRAAGVPEGSLEGIPVVFDFFNGSAGPEMMDALQRAGASVLPLRLVPDGNFPTGSPNPTSAGKMGKAVALAKETGGAAVVGTDGDGDRLVFGDGNGILSAGMAAIPILRHAHPGGAHEKQAKVLHDPKVNPLALAEWAGLDVAPVLFRNGHSHIKEHMRSIDALAAVEESGHFYHRLRDGERTIYAENSLVTILLFLRSLKERSSLMDELWETQNRVFTTGEFNYQLENNQMRDAALEKALQCFSEEGAAVTSRTADGMDLMGFFVRGGITLNTGEPRTGWYQVYIRIATNEKAVIRSYVSADDPEVGLRKEKGLRDIFTSFGGRVID